MTTMMTMMKMRAWRIRRIVIFHNHDDCDCYHPKGRVPYAGYLLFRLRTKSPWHPRLRRLPRRRRRRLLLLCGFDAALLCCCAAAQGALPLQPPLLLRSCWLMMLLCFLASYCCCCRLPQIILRLLPLLLLLFALSRMLLLLLGLRRIPASVNLNHEHIESSNKTETLHR